ncbi:MAG: (d)CMP kinase [Bacillota bacterium]
MKCNIAIDGPAGAGKSSVAKLVAQKLGYLYVDTGAMYRALTWKALQNGIPFDEASLANLAKTTSICFQQDKASGKQLVICDGIDITDKIREPKVAQAVSLLASFAKVRQQLTVLQRQYAAMGGVVMDGRDIGTFVLPDADYKFFLTASIGTRSKRRYLELKNKGISVTLEEIRDEIVIRDSKDKTRKHAPLKMAEDAEILDTTNLSIEEVVSFIVSKCER